MSKRGEWVHVLVDHHSRTIPGHGRNGRSGYNHRVYSMTTRDWKTFSPARSLVRSRVQLHRFDLRSQTESAG